MKADQGTSLAMEERALRHACLQDTMRIDTALPERFGAHPHIHGKIKRLNIRPGFNVTAFDLESAGVFRGFASTEPCLAIVVLLDCSGSGRILSPGSNRPLQIVYSPETTFFFARTSVLGEFDVPVGANFKGVEIRLSMDQLRLVDGLDLFANVDLDHSYCRAANASVWIGGVPTSAGVRAHVEAILSAALGPDESDLTVEAAGLAILTAGLESMRSRGSVLSARQRRLSSKLERAKSVLLDDLARTWTVCELAETVGLSERQLKAGFRARFGTPVYEFLQSARLVRAKTLLDEGVHSVTEVALTVGYANPSHFSFLFRRAFGVPPSHCAKRLGK